MERSPILSDMSATMDSILGGKAPRNLLTSDESMQPDDMGVYVLTNAQSLHGAGLIAARCAERKKGMNR
jgi:hypothetical protein